MIGIELGQVAINVRLSHFGGDWFNAIQDKDAAEFWKQLLYVFSPLAAIGIASAILQLVLRAYLTIRWRRWMTEKTIGNWLDGSALYRMQLTGSSSDNPDQRIADDINLFNTTTFSLGLGFLSKADLAGLPRGDLVDAVGRLRFLGHRHAGAGLPVLDRADLRRPRGAVRRSRMPIERTRRVETSP